MKGNELEIVTVECCSLIAECYLLNGHPLLSGHLGRSRRCPLNRGFTVYLCDFAKRCPISFRLNTGIARVQAGVAGKKTTGLAVLLSSPDPDLSVGGRLTCLV